MSIPGGDAEVSQAGILPVLETPAGSSEPAPVSPVGFSLIAGLIGMAMGLVLAPWIEKWFKRFGS